MVSPGIPYLTDVSADTLFHSGEFNASIPIPSRVALEQRETTLEGDDKLEFLNLMAKMLQWQPERRSLAKELAEDLWVRNHTR